MALRIKTSSGTIRDINTSERDEIRASLGIEDAPVVPAPVFTTQPVVSGTAQQGQTLTSTTGVASNASTYARQWLRNGSAISAQTGASYVLTLSDVGAAISVRVAATGPTGLTATATSAATSAVIAAAVAPGAPTSPVATAGDGTASVTATAPSSTGGASLDRWRVIPYIGSTAGTPVENATLPIAVTPLTNGQAYTFKVQVRNAAGLWSVESPASSSVTPTAASSGSTLGIIAANRTQLPTNAISIADGYTARREHWAHPAGAVSNLKTVDVGWWFNTNNVTDIAAAVTIKRFIEYPAGVFTPVTWGGSPSLAIQPAGNHTSDAVAITIPAGQRFWIRTVHISGAARTAAILTMPGSPTALGTTDGDASTDMGDTGTIPVGTVSTSFGPAAILGDVAVANAKSVVLYGDSIVHGEMDSTGSGSKGGSGYLSRHFDNSTVASYTRVAKGGWSSPMSLKNNARPRVTAFLESISYTDFVFQLGINDLRRTSGTDGTNAAGVLANMQTIFTFKPGPRNHVCTLTPYTQAGVPSSENNSAQANEYNDAVRAGLANVTSVVEAADASMTGRNTRIWKAGYSDDALHPNSVGSAAIAAAISIAL